MVKLVGVLLTIGVIGMLVAFVVHLVSVAVMYTYGFLAHIMIIMTVFNAIVIAFYLIRFARWIHGKRTNTTEEEG